MLIHFLIVHGCFVLQMHLRSWGTVWPVKPKMYIYCPSVSLQKKLVDLCTRAWFTTKVCGSVELRDISQSRVSLTYDLIYLDHSENLEVKVSEKGTSVKVWCFYFWGKMWVLFLFSLIKVFSRLYFVQAYCNKIKIDGKIGVALSDHLRTVQILVYFLLLFLNVAIINISISLQTQILTATQYFIYTCFVLLRQLCSLYF